MLQESKFAFNNPTFTDLISLCISSTIFSICLVVYYQHLNPNYYFQPSNQQFAATYQIKPISIKEVKGMMDGSEIILVDARLFEDFTRGHLPGAISLPEENFNQKLMDYAQTIASAKAIIVYCGNSECDRADKVAVKLQDLGFRNLYIMVEGYQKWRQAYGP